MSLLRFAFHRALPAMAIFLVVPAGSARLAAQAPAAAPATTPPPPPRFTPTPEMLATQAASEKEHQRELDVLGIKELRRGVDGDAKSVHAANYDESRANVYPTLPDPLVLNDGKRVTTAKVWWSKRRPEIAEMFDREILGRTPANTPKVTWEVVSTTREKNGDVEVITRQLSGHVDNSIDPAIKVDIDLTLDMAAAGAGPGMGIRRAGSDQLPGRQRRGVERGHHRPDEQGPAAQDGRLGHAEGLGLGREPGA
jgi:hypothetical protein